MIFQKLLLSLVAAAAIAGRQIPFLDTTQDFSNALILPATHAWSNATLRGPPILIFLPGAGIQPERYKNL